MIGGLINQNLRIGLSIESHNSHTESHDQDHLNKKKNIKKNMNRLLDVYE